MIMDYLIRAESQTVFRTYAQDWGWIDEENRPTPGTRIDELGPVVIEPAVIGEDHEIITPAVMDDWHHVNVRVLEDGEEKIARAFEADSRMSEMRDVTVIEKGEEPTRIQLLHPADVDSIIRVWADGMNFASELPDILSTQPAAKKAKAKK